MLKFLLPFPLGFNFTLVRVAVFTSIIVITTPFTVIVLFNSSVFLEMASSLFSNRAFRGSLRTQPHVSCLLKMNNTSLVAERVISHRCFQLPRMHNSLMNMQPEAKTGKSKIDKRNGLWNFHFF